MRRAVKRVSAKFSLRSAELPLRLQFPMLPRFFYGFAETGFFGGCTNMIKTADSRSAPANRVNETK